MTECAVIYIICFLLLLLVTRHRRFKGNGLKWLLFLFVISLSVIAFEKEPKSDWDLSRHFVWLNQIRVSDMSLFESILKNETGTGNAEYTSLISFNAIRYLIVKMFANNHMFPLICVFASYLIVAYIIWDWSRLHTSMCNGEVLFSIIICFAFMPYVYVYSGIRNGLAACIGGLGVYLYLHKRINLLKLSIILFISATIHPAMLMAIPFIWLAKVKPGVKGILLIVGVPILLQILMKIFIMTGQSFLVLIANKYFYYTSERQYVSTRVFLYGDIILIVLLIIGFYLRKRNFQREDNAWSNYLTWYMFFILGNIGNYDLILRPSYLLGVFAPVYTGVFYQNQLKRADIRSLVLLGIKICISGIALFMCYSGIAMFR